VQPPLACGRNLGFCHQGRSIKAAIRSRVLPCLTLLWLGAFCAAAQAGSLNERANAASCSACHGTEGRASQDSTIPALAGLGRAEMLRLMNAFKDGSRPATVMHQIAKGLTEAQLIGLADYFASVQRQP
jgi:cytochrome subunit of sulfide dehydrogenase